MTFPRPLDIFLPRHGGLGTALGRYIAPILDKPVENRPQTRHTSFSHRSSMLLNGNQGTHVYTYICCGSILTLVQSGIFLCFIFTIIYHHTPKQRKIPNCIRRVKLNHSVCNSRTSDTFISLTSSTINVRETMKITFMNLGPLLVNNDSFYRVLSSPKVVFRNTFSS